jgi:Ca2+-binding RTX toxin-like protein
MRARRVRWSTALLCAVVPVLPPAAEAAVVQLHAGGESAAAVGLVVTGLPGEANRLEIVRGSDGVVTVTDAGAPLLPGARCAGGGGAVTCSGGLPNAELTLTIATSDGDDALSLAGLADYGSSNVRAGSGNDVIAGGAGRDDLSGDAGDDQLEGGGGSDGLGGGPGADVLGGGPGIDTVSYGGDQPVTVTLDGLPGDGAPDEGDHIGADVENVTGTVHPDRLIGSDGPNRLDGGDGDDELIGAGGDDVLISSSLAGGRLVGGPGRDVLNPGTYSTVDARDSEVDRVRCRALARPLRADAIDRLFWCVPNAVLRGSRGRVDSSGRLEMRARCAAIQQRCLMRVELRYGGATLARASLRIEAPRDRPAIRLNALGRRLLREHATLVVTRRVQSYRTRPAPSASRAYGTPYVLRR